MDCLWPLRIGIIRISAETRAAFLTVISASMGTLSFKLLFILIFGLYEISIVSSYTHRRKYIGRKKVGINRSSHVRKGNNADSESGYQGGNVGRELSTNGSVSNVNKVYQTGKQMAIFQRPPANEKNDYLNEFHAARIYDTAALFHNVPGHPDNDRRTQRPKRGRDVSYEEFEDEVPQNASGDEEINDNEVVTIKNEEESDFDSSGDVHPDSFRYYHKPEEPENDVSFDFQYSGMDERTADLKSEMAGNVETENQSPERFVGSRTIEEMEGEPSSVIENFFGPNAQEKEIIQRELLRPQIQKVVSDEVSGNSLISLLSQVATIL